MHTPFAIAAVVLAVAMAGCQYNKTCAYPVDGTGDIVFHSTDAVPLSPREVFAQESAVGDALVDSYRAVLATTTAAPAVALETAAAIHDDGPCVPADAGASGLQLPAGPVTRQLLKDVLPAPNQLVVESIPLRTLFNILEHGVAGPQGAIDLSTGRFVEASGLTYTVDCSQPSEIATRLSGQLVRTAEGARVTSLTLGGQTFSRADRTLDTEPVAVALPESMAQGGDAFFDLRDLWSRQGAAAWQETTVTTFDAWVQFLERLESTGGHVTLRTDGRVTLMNCRAAP